MVLNYNIYFELSSMILLLLLLIAFGFLYNLKTTVNQAYFKLMILALLTNLLDVITAITIKNYTMVDPLLNTVINMLYLLIAMIASFCFYDFILVYVDGKEQFKRLTQINCVLLFGYLVLLVVNIFTGMIYSFNMDKGYVHGPIFAVNYLLPLYYGLCGGIVLAHRLKKYSLRQCVVMLLCLVVSMSGSVIQAIFLPDVLLSAFTPTIGIVLMLFFIRSADYEKLNHTMETIQKDKEDAEMSKTLFLKSTEAGMEFLSDISHEMSTPINAILGYNELVMKETEEDHRAEYARSIQAAGRALLSLENDILDYINMDSGHLTLKQDVYEVLPLLQDAVTYAQICTEQKNLTLNVDIDENIPGMLLGDATRLFQIFNNLISNAVRHMEEGTIGLSVHWKEKDENSGFMTVVIKGSGLDMKTEAGFPIVTELLELMDSNLDVHSEYGKGSTFSFRVEQDIIDKTPVGKVFGNHQMSLIFGNEEDIIFYAPGAKILAVDDNRSNLDFVSEVLKETAIQVDTAQNGEEALSLLRVNTYDMVLLDQIMPILDGVETLKIIRDEHICEEVPVIAITANVTGDEREEDFDVGFTDYMVKPVSENQLRRMIYKYLPKDVLKPARDMGYPMEGK